MDPQMFSNVCFLKARCMVLFKRMVQGARVGQVNVLRYNEAAFINVSVNLVNIKCRKCLKEKNCFEHEMFGWVSLSKCNEES